MSRFAAIAAVVGLLLAPAGQKEADRAACVQRCYAPLTDPEMQRQELVSLEKEAAHAIELKNGTFFRRVYGDDFVGTLSHGQQVNKAQWAALIESADVKYESFNTSDIKVQIYQDIAVSTCLWSARSVVKGQRVSNQMRVIHVYLNTPYGWRVVSGQTTSLPPDVQQVL
ncbi:MAG TPA: nuclear transport factor 2 family protein [Candidatus Angelobacter sp.]|nr:nuclear transport factor 2 family protein [Candidatus Angelobacter sp.]